jgi:transcriptional regulator with AAA-type ATPase domain
MNEEQSNACKLALAGHSFLLTGQAGTGKSYTAHQMIV